ncbi:MAG: phage tail protein, partial [Thermodesulfobacteriota bacterium]
MADELWAESSPHVMLALGGFLFAVSTAAYQRLQRSAEYRWPAQERFGRPPARQFTGPGAESVELDGVLYPHHAGGRMDQV